MFRVVVINLIYTTSDFINFQQNEPLTCQWRLQSLSHLMLLNGKWNLIW